MLFTKNGITWLVHSTGLLIEQYPPNGRAPIVAYALATSRERPDPPEWNEYLSTWLTEAEYRELENYIFDGTVDFNVGKPTVH